MAVRILHPRFLGENVEVRRLNQKVLRREEEADRFAERRDALLARLQQRCARHLFRKVKMRGYPDGLRVCRKCGYIEDLNPLITRPWKITERA